SGRARAALAGSALLAIDTGASTISIMPSRARPSTCRNSSAGPNRIVRAPSSPASAAPAATSAGPRSAPLQSTAITTSASGAPDLPVRPSNAPGEPELSGLAPGSPLIKLQLAQLRPARVFRALVRVLGSGFVQVDRALRTQPRTVLFAQHLCRDGQRERVVRPRRHIQALLVHVRARQLLAFAWHIDLARLHLDRRRRLL